MSKFFAKATAEIDQAERDLDHALGRLCEVSTVMQLRKGEPQGEFSRGPRGEFEVWSKDESSLTWAIAALRQGPSVAPKLVEVPTREEISARVRDLWGRVLPGAPVPEKYRLPPSK